MALWHWAGSGGAVGLGLVASDAVAFCVAGVALGDIHLRFPRQASHLATSTFVSRGRRGDMCLRFPWQAWHLWQSQVTPRHFAWQAWHLTTSTFVSRCRRGTWRHVPSLHVAGVALMAPWNGSGGALGLGLVAGDAAALCVAGVALGDMHLHFMWQAWHLVTSTFVLRGRRGTW